MPTPMQQAHLLAALHREGLAHWRHAIQHVPPADQGFYVKTLARIWARQPHSRPRGPVAHVKTAYGNDSLFHANCKYAAVSHHTTGTDYVRSVTGLIRAMHRAGLLPITPPREQSAGNC